MASNTIEIRVAHENDLDEITSLFRQTILQINSKDYNEEQVKAWSAAADKKEAWLLRLREQYFICAVAGEMIVGFASLAQDGYLDLMYVHANWQGRGIASLLVTSLENYAVGKNLASVYADVSITAKPFFEAKGFFAVKEQQKEIGDIVFINYRMEKKCKVV